MKKIAKKQKLALRREVVRSLSTLELDQLRRAAGARLSGIGAQNECTQTSQVVIVCTSYGYQQCQPPE